MGGDAGREGPTGVRSRAIHLSWEEKPVQEKNAAPAASNNGDKILFWACFVALIATAFGFVLRTMVIGDWGLEFNLTETQKGEIFGVGLWPFAISIVLFSFIIDRIGYGTAMAFAFVCHVASAILTIAAPWIAAQSDDPNAAGYWTLYIGTFIVALGNGTVEAVVNPVVATMFWREKAKWLNMLHAGWPGGLVIGGLLAIFFADWGWQLKIALILLPTIVYGIMMLGRKFPVHERVAAGVSYLAMLKEVGF
ncbi:MAG: MFS transporter, partial [Candidatus Hydrogenedentes bacterium]|nr:MFS transporter [Candidatus Hydrogenedentota bacterium]